MGFIPSLTGGLFSVVKTIHTGQSSPSLTLHPLLCSSAGFRLQITVWLMPVLSNHSWLRTEHQTHHESLMHRKSPLHWGTAPLQTPLAFSALVQRMLTFPMSWKPESQL